VPCPTPEGTAVAGACLFNGLPGVRVDAQVKVHVHTSPIHGDAVGQEREDDGSATLERTLAGFNGSAARRKLTSRWKQPSITSSGAPPLGPGAGCKGSPAIGCRCRATGRGVAGRPESFLARDPFLARKSCSGGANRAINFVCGAEGVGPVGCEGASKRGGWGRPGKANTEKAGGGAPQHTAERTAGDSNGSIRTRWQGPRRPARWRRLDTRPCSVRPTAPAHP
jgi:hypothetical protein